MGSSLAQAARAKGKVWESGGRARRRMRAKKTRGEREEGEEGERIVWALITLLKVKVVGFLTRLKRETA